MYRFRNYVKNIYHCKIPQKILFTPENYQIVTELLQMKEFSDKGSLKQIFRCLKYSEIVLQF